MAYTPCVIVPGIGQSKIELLDNQGKKVKMAWQLDVDTDKVVNELKFPLVRTLLLRRDLGLSKKTKQVMKDIVDPVATNVDGTMKNNIRVVNYPQSLAKCTEDERNYIYHMVPMQRLAKIIGEDKMYFFAYNSFGEPYETAAMLNDFIQQIKAEHNCEQVNLVPVSLGGAVSIAYFDAYGEQNDIHRVMYFVAALQGTPVISDLLSHNIRADKVLSLIEFLFPHKTAEAVGKLLKILPKNVREKFIISTLDGIIEAAILPCPSLWSTVPPEIYEGMEMKYLSDPKWATLKEKTHRFFEAQRDFPNQVKKQMAQGVEFFAICGYGLQLLPIIATDKLNSDTMIPCVSASLGATVAPLGEKLDLPENDTLSPDKTVDASTSLFGNRVWYFLGQQHDATAYNDTALDVATRVLSDDSFTDVYSDPTLPRYGKKQDNRR